MSARFFASAISDMFLPIPSVMAGLGPGIHLLPKISYGVGWMRGSSPRMTMYFLWEETISPPCSPVLFVLRLDGVAGLGPVGVGPVAQLVEIAAHGERLAAIHRDGLAVDPVAAAGDQKHREVLQLLHAADPAHRILRLGSRAGLVAGFYPFAHALGRNFAGRDGIEADAMAAPFGGKRHGHGVNGGLAHGRGHHIRRAVAHPGHRDRYHIAGLL